MRRHRELAAIAAVAILGALLAAGCSAENPGTEPAAGTTRATGAEPSIGSPSAAKTPAPATSPSEQVAGTIVHFTTGTTVVEATISEDTPTTRDFLSMLPMTLEFEDYGGREKITYPARPFDYDGAPGITPQAGDLFSYMPWGNLGFFYDADGLGHDDDLVRLGTTDDLDQVQLLDGQVVTIQRAQ